LKIKSVKILDNGWRLTFIIPFVVSSHVVFFNLFDKLINTAHEKQFKVCEFKKGYVLKRVISQKGSVWFWKF